MKNKTYYRVSLINENQDADIGEVYTTETEKEAIVYAENLRQDPANKDFKVCIERMLKEEDTPDETYKRKFIKDKG